MKTPEEAIPSKNRTDSTDYSQFLVPTPMDDWGPATLAALNIRIHPTPSQAFFGPKHFTAGSVSHIPDLIFDVEDIDHLPSDADAPEAVEQFFSNLELATHHAPEAGAAGFMQSVLHLLGFDRPLKELVVIQRYTYNLWMGNSVLRAQTDVALLHRRSSMLLLTVVEDRAAQPGSLPGLEAQAVGGAIAAVQWNEALRMERCLPPLGEVEVPFMVLKGAVPTLYTMRVTRDLLSGLRTLTRPEGETVVRRCIPDWVRAGKESERVGWEDGVRRKEMLVEMDRFRRLVEELRGPLLSDFALGR